MSPSIKIRILILDDHTLFREGLVRLLGAEPDFEIVAHCGSVEDALDSLRTTKVDVVLLDIDLPGERGSEMISRSRGMGFEGRILVVTAGIPEREAVEVLEQGAAGIFPKHSSPSLLAKSIRDVMAGEVWLEQRYLDAVLRAAAQPEAEDVQRSGLTGRECQVLRGVFEGLANKQIAARLGISEGSVKATLQQLFDKTGVRTRSQLVRVALERYGDWMRPENQN
jgi:DNA-binding NarL/FixJ family response regulator